MPRFTGKFTRINVSLPTDMVEYLRIRKNQEGVPISMQVRMAVERDVMDRVAAKHAAPAGTDVLGNHPGMCELDAADRRITEIADTEIVIDRVGVTADLIIENRHGRWYGVSLGGDDWDYLSDNGEYVPVPADPEPIPEAE